MMASPPSSPPTIGQPMMAGRPPAILDGAPDSDSVFDNTDTQPSQLASPPQMPTPPVQPDTAPLDDSQALPMPIELPQPDAAPLGEQMSPPAEIDEGDDHAIVPAGTGSSPPSTAMQLLEDMGNLRESQKAAKAGGRAAAKRGSSAGDGSVPKKKARPTRTTLSRQQKAKANAAVKAKAKAAVAAKTAPPPPPPAKAAPQPLAAAPPTAASPPPAAVAKIAPPARAPAAVAKTAPPPRAAARAPPVRVAAVSDEASRYCWRARIPGGKSKGFNYRGRDKVAVRQEADAWLQAQIADNE